MGVLGETLQQARQAHGISLAKAAQETRVPSYYLEALEQEDFAVLPAPIFTRGFLRIYTQYLGLSTSELLPLYPDNEKDEPELQPLPEMPEAGVRPMNWVVGGSAMLILFLIVVIVYQLGRGSDSLSTANELVSDSQAAQVSRESASTPAPASTAELRGTGGLIAPVAEGTLPDFRGASLSLAQSILSKQKVKYIVISVANSGVPAGTVYDQSPPAGSPITDTMTVTLLVSRG